MAESKQHQKGSTEKQIMVLKKLGFSDDEARIYHVLLVSKESTVVGVWSMIWLWSQPLDLSRVDDPDWKFIGYDEIEGRI